MTVLSATGLDDLRAAEARLAHPLTTVRRVVVASLAPFPTAALTRLVARVTARHRAGRVLWTSTEWASFGELSPERRAAAPPDAADRLRAHGPVWVGAPGLDDRYFDLAFADAGVVATDSLPDLARSHGAVCLVVPPARSSAEDAIGMSEQLNREGHRVVLAVDRTRPGRDAWVRAVAPRLASPLVTLRADAAFTRPARPFHARTVVAATLIGSYLLTDPEGSAQ